MRYYTLIKDEDHFNRVKMSLGLSTRGRTCDLNWSDLYSYQPIAIYYSNNMFDGWDRERDAINSCNRKDLFGDILPKEMFEM